jgi:two-component system, LytTR family, sensor kinase
VTIHYGISIRESWMDASITSSILVLAGYVMITIVKYFKPSGKNAVAVLISALALAVLTDGVLFSVLKMLPSSTEYLLWLDNTLLIRFIFIWLMIVIAGINGWLFFYIKEHQQNELREKETEKLMREAELSGLRQQFQPHFIFNSLNSISALAGTNPSLARKMIEQLSDFLRGTVKKESNLLVPLKDEFNHLQLYLDIEKVRFGHRLMAEVKADDAALEMKLPSLLLQPVLENAIKFGLYDTIGEVVITVEARADQNNLIVEIKNPFDPSLASPKPGTGFGLNSIQRRLSLLFYRNDLLTTKQNENTFTTTIKIPQR